MLLLVTALFLGILHAFGPDHLAAVSTFVSHRRKRGGALGVSLRWGIAHLMGVLVPGVVLSSLAAPVPERFTPYAELAAGVVLVYVGVASLRRNLRARKVDDHPHSHGSLIHAHLHTPDHGEKHYGEHAISLTGIVHGLAGAMPALAFVPVAVMGSPWEVATFLLVFGLGVILAMAGYCLALGGLLQRLSETHVRRWAQPALGCFSCMLGVFWIFHTNLLG